ncbi:MAG: NRDE family protein [Candidatus Eisenbacteria bacterium]|nr:NRDE family protein [Candidatus Eisenbacteria bacterium]
MCTLILGLGVVAPRTVVLAANRDEDPARPSDPPVILSHRPLIVGGRDRVAGGTWLALRGPGAVVAMLNRRGEAGAAPRRSRGLLTLDVARAPEAAAARGLVARDRYAPFTLLCATPDKAWVLTWDGRATRITIATPGWHVLTHAEMDDPTEPRTASLLESLAGFAPRSRAAAEARLCGLLSRHGEPAVCLHEGRMATVSAALVWLAAGETSYRHAEGRPCVTPFQDFSPLLADAESPSEDG